MAAKKKPRSKKSQQTKQQKPADDQKESENDSVFAAGRTKNNPSHGVATSTVPSAYSINGNLIHVNPSRIRFQHSRIRPYFSGCGRSVVETLEEIRRGELSPADLPPIQVLVGPDENDGLGPWYFSLNNRRLWVIKRCQEEGLLPDNSNGTILVRVRLPKSGAEVERYSLENCALDAKFMRERSGNKAKMKNNVKKKGVELEKTEDVKEVICFDEDNVMDALGGSNDENLDEKEADFNGMFQKYSSIFSCDDSESESESESGDEISHKNPFDALL